MADAAAPLPRRTLSRESAAVLARRTSARETASSFADFLSDGSSDDEADVEDADDADSRALLRMQQQADDGAYSDAPFAGGEREQLPAHAAEPAGLAGRAGRRAPEARGSPAGA